MTFAVARPTFLKKDNYAWQCCISWLLSLQKLRISFLIYLRGCKQTHGPLGMGPVTGKINFCKQQIHFGKAKYGPRLKSYPNHQQLIFPQLLNLEKKRLSSIQDLNVADPIISTIFVDPSHFPMPGDMPVFKPFSQAWKCMDVNFAVEASIMWIFLASRCGDVFFVSEDHPEQIWIHSTI